MITVCVRQKYHKPLVNYQANSIIPMPDLTDQILAETTPDPRYNPLSPTVGKLEDYAHNVRSELAEQIGESELEIYEDDLNYQGNHITYEWATNEMLGHQMNWVRVGLVAERVRRYRIYRHKFPTWNDYCKKILGKQSWQMKQTINAALAVMELIRHGFPILPNCAAQANKLLECCKKGQMLLVDAWDKVLEEVPLAHLMTSNRIGEALGFPSEKKRITLPAHLRDRLEKAADEEGLTVAEKITQLLDSELPDPEAEINPENDPELPPEAQLWHREMTQLVQEHDRQLWLWGAITRLLNPDRKSQYSWLRQLRLQT